MSFSERENEAIAITPHVTGLISVLGSLCVVRDILKDPVKRKRTYARLLLGTCFFDALASLSFAFGSRPIPKGSPNPYAIGTTATCTTQGFFVQMSLACPIYSFGLTLYYLLVLVHKWPDRKVARLEWPVHVTATVLTLGTALAGIPLKIYNNSNLWCWISSNPPSCGNTPDGDPETCIRGKNAWLYRWIFYYAPSLIFLIFGTAVMARVTWHVWAEERQSRKWRHAALPEEERSKTRDKLHKLSSQVFWQSVHYVLAFYLSLFFPTLVRLKQTLEQPVSARLVICMCIFAPLQGFWNCWIYFRPRYLYFREQKPGGAFLQLCWRAVRDNLSSQKTTHSTANTTRRGDPQLSHDFINQGSDDAGGKVPAAKKHRTMLDADIMDIGHQYMLLSRLITPLKLSYTSRRHIEDTEPRSVNGHHEDPQKLQEDREEVGEQNQEGDKEDPRDRWQDTLGASLDSIQRLDQNLRSELA